MFGDLLKGVFDSEKAITETITTTLQNLSEELGCQYNELFVMIKPVNEAMEHKFWVYRVNNGKPEIVREIPIKEILDS